MKTVSISEQDLMQVLIPAGLVDLIVEDVRVTQLGTPQSGVAIAKVAANRGTERYQPYACFLKNITPAERVTLCRVVGAAL